MWTIQGPITVIVSQMIYGEKLIEPFIVTSRMSSKRQRCDHLKLESDDSSALGMVEGYKLFLWAMWSVVKRKKIMWVGSFRCCQTPEREFEITWCLKSLVLNLEKDEKILQYFRQVRVLPFASTFRHRI